MPPQSESPIRSRRIPRYLSTTLIAATFLLTPVAASGSAGAAAMKTTKPAAVAATKLKVITA